MEKIEKLDLLGRGGGGAVYRARHMDTGELMAMKVIKLRVDEETRKRRPGFACSFW